MRKYITIVIGIICTFSSRGYAEKTKGLEGVVVDAKSLKPIPNVICKLYDVSGKMLGYFLTDTKGSYHIKAYPIAKRVTYAHMGYKIHSIPYIEAMQEHRIKLYTKVQKIAQVTVHVPPIKGTKDTIRYNIGSFVEKKDRTIGDVLKKLPGIEVSKNGTVKYQGEAISRFYIEGKDLLGGAYNQATNSLPVDAVAQVQIMEHHQHKRALEGTAPPRQAALNVTIKKGHKMRMFGEVKGGIGTPWTSWDNSVFLMRVNPKHQALITGKMNNIGKDISGETSNRLDYSNQSTFDPLPEDLYGELVAQQIPLPTSRYLDNNSLCLGVNELFSLSKHTEFRVNTSYYGDATDQSCLMYQRYGVDNPVTVQTFQQGVYKTNRVVPQLQIEHNGDQFYLEDKMKASFSWQKQDFSVTNNGVHRKQVNRQSPNFMDNTLDMSLRKEKWLFSMRMLLRYYDGESKMDVWNASSSKKETSPWLHQVADRNYWVAKGEVGIGSLHSKRELKLRLHYLLKQDHLSSIGTYDFVGNPLDTSVSGDQTKSEYSLGMTPSYRWRFRGGYVHFELPFKVEKLGWETSSENQYHYYISYIPKIYFNYEHLDLWEFRLDASYDSDVSNDLVVTQTPFFKDYRTLYRNQSDMDQWFDRVSRFQTGGSIMYKDLATMFFSSLSGTYYKNWSHQYHDYRYSSQLTEILPTWGSNESEFLYVSGIIDKTLYGTGLTFKLKGDYNNYKSLFSQNGEQFYNRSQIVTGTFTTIFKKYKWFSLDYNLVGNYMWQKYEEVVTDPLRSFTHRVDFHLYPFKTVILSMVGDYTQRELSKERFSNYFFMDAELRFSPGKRWDFSFVVSNLFDQDQYKIGTESGVNYSYIQLPLRDRSMRMKVALKL
ncbi:hypothetical protein K4L44_12840 [Halosquirtibacter laminarini]|uniref:Uncharacterized protein n=1 Tax=Halosquirtibacter laminarini TaxID=3374600 RepID=A0AC61ND26_9BACT|nr:hypothetical protein K4L44_12840 [Prolixibacteraceae bacterium]